MSRIIRIYWDFRGPDAAETAKHHLRHLEEFIAKEEIPLYGRGIAKNNEDFHSAFIEIKEDKVEPVRDALKPQRAFVVE